MTEIKNKGTINELFDETYLFFESIFIVEL